MRKNAALLVLLAAAFPSFAAAQTKLGTPPGAHLAGTPISPVPNLAAPTFQLYAPSPTAILGAPAAAAPTPVPTALAAIQPSVATPDKAGSDALRASAAALFDGAGKLSLTAAAVEPETSVVAVANLDAALKTLRAASHPRHETTDGVLAKLSALYPDLPLSPDFVFLVRDPAALAPYGIPSAAAGAARILSDGRDERKVILLVAGQGVSLDDFIEYSLHEAVHLKDDGILRLPHERFVEHWFAEGYTQLRAHSMANAGRRALGRPERANGAYSREVAVIERLIAKYGEAPLKLLVETGSDAGLRRTLGRRWQDLLALAHENRSSTQRQRDYFLRLAEVVIAHPEFGPDSFREAARRLHGDTLVGSEEHALDP